MLQQVMDGVWVAFEWVQPVPLRHQVVPVVLLQPGLLATVPARSLLGLCGGSRCHQSVADWEALAAEAVVRAQLLLLLLLKVAWQAVHLPLPHFSSVDHAWERRQCCHCDRVVPLLLHMVDAAAGAARHLRHRQTHRRLL